MPEKKFCPRPAFLVAWVVSFALAVVSAGESIWPGGGGATAASEVAARINRVLREDVPFASPTPPPPIDDQRFLRRVTLDLIGRLPSPEEVTAFSLDPATDKRAAIVEQLLADERYGRNWGRYWRDVIMYRKTEERQQFLVGIPLESYLAEALNQNKPWSEIATEFITATGPANSNGACGLIVAQQGQPEEIVGEISRIFLGIQIQCAQCHDHPTDRWKREQFHQLAAFFPRVASQPSRQGLMQQMLPEITVAVTDRKPLFNFRGPMNIRRGTLEHYMSDPKDPQSEGTLMQPVLFATGDEVPLGTVDAERRGSLAKWITKTENPYFAQAFVNRLWSELTGEGFYEPVDDIGPDRMATAPQTLDVLARDFAESGYDVKRLFRVIMATELYQLPSQPRREPDEAPMQHNVAQRLRGDQIFDNVLAVLETNEPAAMGPGGGPMARFARGPRQQFAVVFGYDPSVRRDEVQTTIPQALALMNAPLVGGALRGSGNTMLARKLAEIKDDDALVQELYLRVLGREATSGELKACLEFVADAGNRTEAFEDVLWSLVNSAEFLHRT
jgi:hypothetical protein